MPIIIMCMSRCSWSPYPISVEMLIIIISISTEIGLCMGDQLHPLMHVMIISMIHISLYLVQQEDYLFFSLKFVCKHALTTTCFIIILQHHGEEIPTSVFFSTTTICCAIASKEKVTAYSISLAAMASLSMQSSSPTPRRRGSLGWAQLE